uniref:Small ribosomal subunit protein mS23 n=1 Tax=Cacopsylla melanoneura TaxID=428564 RepID=A0A8D9BN21_9HEMI
MASSRLEKVGTIFSRVTGLLRAGAMDVKEKPIWYDVYRAFPPKIEPLFSKPIENVPLREIIYPEDSIRAKLHKTLGKKLPAYNLLDKTHPTVSQKIIIQTIQNQKENSSLTEDEALTKAIESYNNEIKQFKADDVPQDINKPKVGYYKKSNLAGEFKKAVESKVDMKKILSDD